MVTPLIRDRVEDTETRLILLDEDILWEVDWIFDEEERRSAEEETLAPSWYYRVPCPGVRNYFY